MSDFTILPLLNSETIPGPEETLILDKDTKRKGGFLIVLEGPDGSGKSTQLRLLKEWLLSQGHEVVITKWKSAPVLAPIIKAKKESRALSPEDYCLLHAADFLFRLENTIIPALKQGKIVLCDRYVFTSLSRDGARGLSKSWVLSLFEPIFRPDVVFYFAISPETALRRILTAREPKYYEAGQDVTHIADPAKSFKVFISWVIDEYEKMSYEYDFLRINAEQPIQAQQRHIHAIIREKFEGIHEAGSWPFRMQPVLQLGAA